MSHPTEDSDDASVSTRWPELVVAGVLLAIALLVMIDSKRSGIGWGDDGPQSGYFPFRVGLLLAGASLTVIVGQLTARQRAVFAERAQLALVVQVFVPMVVYVALIAWLGIYIASLLLIGYFMRRHGRYGWGLTAAVSVGVPLVVFLVFERWFLVPLIKGPVERLLGF